MTPADLDKLQALHEAATPGPWRTTTNLPYETGDKVADLGALDIASYVDTPNSPNEQNAALIVAMRNALPELLAMARDNVPEDCSLLPDYQRCGASWGDQTCVWFVGHGGLHVGDKHRSGWTDEKPGTKPHAVSPPWAHRTQTLTAFAHRFEAERDALASRVREMEETVLHQDGEMIARDARIVALEDYEAIAIQNRDEWMHRADEAEARVAQLQLEPAILAADNIELRQRVAKLEAAMKEIAMQEAWTKSRDIARAALVKP